MKVLLLDACTAQIVSAVYSQTDILNQQVYLVSNLEKGLKHNNNNNTANGTEPQTNKNNTSHLRAICFLRPTAANVESLSLELTHPRYSEYHIFFSGKLDSGLLRKLAEADALSLSLVRQVQEFYADFLPVNDDLWTVQSRHSLPMTVSAGTSWAPHHALAYERHHVGIASMLLALKRKPAAIRYAKQSPCAEELARDIHDTIVADPDLYHFSTASSSSSAAMLSPSSSSHNNNISPNSSVPSRHQQQHRGGGSGGQLLLLILDRRDDPVTPLLSQWTYQAMVHELLGLNNHRVVLRGAPGIAKDLEEVVLSAEDDFYTRHKYANFGELGEAIQRLLLDYQKQTAHHSSANLNTVADMQVFMDKFPELRSQSHVVSKHVAIMGELARLVQVCSLMDVSQLEQSLACSDDHSAHWREVLQRFQSPDVKIPDKLRLGLLYALRYEASANMHMLQQAMTKGGVSSEQVALVGTLLRYGGNLQRSPGGLYYADRNDNIVARMTKNIVGAVAGVDNVYAQHVPLVMDTLNSILRGKLPLKEYPVVPGSVHQNFRNSGSNLETLIPDEILVFMVGGVTYEEGTKIAEFNAAHKGRCQVVLAGSTVHNSTSFLDELRATSMI